MFGPRLTDVQSVAVLGAHCDDIAIGMGATLFQLCRDNPGMAVHALVLTGGDGPRAVEERAALTALTPGAELSLTIAAFPDGRTPAHWAEVKSAIRGFAASCRPQVVFGPQSGDAHQDHRQLAQLVPNEFRDQMYLGYEILKWENDLPHPGVIIPVDDEAAAAKIDALFEHYPSQTGHDWFDREAFAGLMRIRGVHVRSRYAEAFVADTTVIRV